MRSLLVEHLVASPACLLAVTQKKGKRNAKKMVQKKWGCVIRKAKSSLCYRPAVDLIQGTEIIVDWYRKNN
jgi:nucleoside-diphosphate-sugar epimerase